MSIWVMAIIGGILCTQIVNPFFIVRFFRGVSLYLKRNQSKIVRKGKKHSSEEVASNQYFDFEIYNSDEKIKFVVMQIICFAIGTICFLLYYYFSAADRTFTSMASTWWIAGVIFLINYFILYLATVLFCFPTSFIVSTWLYGAGMIALSISLCAGSSLYEFYHPVEANTYLTETNIPVIDVSTMTTLEKEIVLQGYALKRPISRNGEVIIPMSRDDEVSIIGYIILEDKQPIIVKKQLTFTPYQSISNNIDYVVREYLPTSIFFGNWSFQLAPDGEVYFARMYGKFAFLRGGRDISGMLLINATTGECTTYSLDEVPNWIDGISE